MTDKQVIGTTVILGIVTVLVGGYLAARIASPNDEDETEPVAEVQAPARPPAAAAKPTIPVPPPMTIEQAELERLRVENERLRFAVQGSRTRQASTAPVTRPAVRITGAAWLTKNDGSSNVLRGMPVALLPANVPSHVVIDGGAAYLARVEDRIRVHDKVITEAEAYIRANEDPDGFWKRTIDWRKREIEGFNLSKYRFIVSTNPRVVDTLDAYAVLNGLMNAIGPFFDTPGPVIATEAISTATTNVDGKYSIDSVAPGRYYLLAYFRSSVAWVEWLVPVTADGADISVDLFNDNAIVIK